MSYDLNQPRKLVDQAEASVIESANIPRSTFVGSYTHKTTFDQGKLIPVLVEEVLPGDMFKYNVSAYVRMATPLFPMMDNLRLDTHFFFVPNRLVWDNWEKFCGAQTNPGDSIAFTVPQIVSPAGGFGVGEIYDQMGVPVAGQIAGGNTISINALPLRAYALIYNEWFRDQNLVNSITISTGNGPDTESTYRLRMRAKAHDYFTTCLPWPQKFTAPSVPLTGQAPITGLGVTTGGITFPTASNAYWETNASTNVTYPFSTAASNLFVRGTASGAARPQIFADLSLATNTFTINALREAWLVQSLYERDARGGTRYVELLKNQFGVTGSDARLQRPEYIGGGSSPVVITPVANTSNTGLGSIGGAGTSVGEHRASYAADEHGYIIGIASVRSELSYQQGLRRMWTRQTRLDFAWPILSELGEQAVLRKEIYCTGNTTDDNTIFGYQERYQEYRTRPSSVSGLFRSTSTGTIDGWHIAQRFTSAPVLGQTFIEDTAPMSRVLAGGAAENNKQFLADFLFERSATRPLPKYGTPAAIGRF